MSKPTTTTPPASSSAKPDTHPSKSEQGVDLTSPEASTSPSLPNERDESQGMTGGIQSREVQQAHRDVERGLEDTSRGDEADMAYRKLKK